MSYAILYDRICFISMIIPVIILFIIIYKFKKNKINWILIPLTITFGIITFFIISYYATAYVWHDNDIKIFFNLFYIQLILLPSFILTIYLFKEKKKLRIPFLAITIGLLLLFLALDTYVVKIDPNNIDYEYSISINSENSSQGFIYIPFIKTNDYKDTIFNSIKSKYPESINEILETEHGTALNISFNSFIKLKIKGKIDQFIDIDLYGRIENVKEEFIWIYSNVNKNDTISIKFKWEIGYGGGNEIWDFSGNISQDGWSKIKGEINAVSV